MILQELVNVIKSPYLLKCSVTTLDDCDDEHEPLDFNGYVTDLPNEFLKREIYSVNNIDMAQYYIDVTLE